MSLFDTRFAVVDTETTGLNPQENKVIQIAAYGVFRGEITLLYESLINPLCHIPAETSAVHHITDRDVEFANPIEVIWTQVMKVLEQADVLAAHNAIFDRSFLPETGKPWLCTKRLAQHLWPDAPNHKNQTLRYWLGIDVQAEAHNATGDTLVTAHLLLKEIESYLENVGEDSLEALIRLAESPIKIAKMPFGKHFGATLEEVPADYLKWALRNIEDIDADLKASIEKVLQLA